jgi:hypothetical protein
MHRLFFILPLRTVARVGVTLLTLGAPLPHESFAQRPAPQPMPQSGTLRTMPIEDLDKMKQVYNDFKQLEGVFPIPASPETVNMGTFDAATGTFDSVLTTEHEGASAGVRPHTTIPTVTLNAALVKLHFELENNQGGVVVTANGKTTTVPPRQNSVTIAAGFATQVQWSVRSGNKFHNDTLIIKRPYVLGAGAFILPVLPIAVVYAPPQERRANATATYSKTEWPGSTVIMSFSKEDSFTSAEFDALAPFGEKLKGLKDAIKDIPGVATGTLTTLAPYFGAAIAGLQLLVAAFPDDKANLISGESVTQDHKLDTLDVVKDAVTTAAQKGPGIGDVILYLKNVRLVWLFDKGDVRLAVLGAEDLRWYSAEILKEDLQGIELPIGNVAHPGPTEGISIVSGPRSGAVTHLDRDTIESLLKLDPFAIAGPDAELSQNRYERNPGSGGAGEGSFSHVVGHQIEQTDVNANVQFFTHLKDTKPGWLSLFGVGDKSEEIIKTTVTHGSSVAERSGKTIEETLNFVAPPDDPKAPYFVDIYYDRVFGTLAFKETPPDQRRRQH